MSQLQLQLQPEIIAATVIRHFQSNGVNQNISETTTIELVRGDQKETPDSTPSDLVTRRCDTWISSTPWMNFLLGSFEYHSRARLQKGKPRQEYEAKYRLPYWVSSTAFHVQGYSHLSNWRINYRSYRIMPLESPFFRAIETGDIHTVQRMIGDKSAFVTDCNEYGESALHVSRFRI